MRRMTDDAPDEPMPSDPGVTERTALRYREDLIAELETENSRLRERTDTLQRWLNERTSELRAFGIAAQAVQGARRVVHQPTLLARVPGAAMRAVRGGGTTPAVERPVVPVPPASQRLAGPGSSRRIGALRDPSTLTVALVADEPLALALGPECRVICLTPGNWPEELAANRPDLLLVESAWRASAGAWQYRIAWYGHPTSIGLVDLRALAAWCTANGIPSVFWETSGPAARGRFDEAASLFDVILTTDPLGLAHYDALPGRRARIVDLLEPAIQFRHHHPGADGQDSSGAGAGRPVFVGAYDRTRPLADREALDRLLDAGLEHDLVIHDTAGVAGPDEPGFPARFQAAIAPTMSTDRLPDVLRQAGAVLIEAPGGDARILPVGLLEALACGAPVIATPSLAIRALFGDQVPGASPADDPAAALAQVLADRTAARAAVRRRILPMLARDFRMRDRLARLAAAADIATSAAAPSVAVAVLHDLPGETATVLASLAGLGDASEFLIGTTDWDRAGSVLAAALRAARPEVSVRLLEQPSAATSVQRLERLAAAASAEWIAAWSAQGAPAGATDDGGAIDDPLEAVLLAAVIQSGDRIAGAHARLPLAVRRGSVLAGGWPATVPGP